MPGESPINSIESSLKRPVKTQKVVAMVLLLAAAIVAIAAGQVYSRFLSPTGIREAA